MNYSLLEKPFFYPSDYVFQTVWSIIYPIVAIGFIYLLYLIQKKQISRKNGNRLLIIFAFNMVGNIAFAPVLFGLQSFFLSSMVIFWVWATLTWFEIEAIKQSKMLFWLFFPYLIWITFVAYLHIMILWLNGF